MVSFQSLPSIKPEVRSKLHSKNLSAEDLINAVLNGYSAFTATSAMHPTTFPGNAAWAYTVEGLRINLVPKGWDSQDRCNQPQVVSPDGQIVITVSSGCPNTGNAVLEPQTRGPKGSETTRGIANNLQTDMFPNEKEAEIAKLFESENSSKEYWILLFYYDFAQKELRLELSRPIKMGVNGKVDGWADRVIIPALPLDGDYATEQPVPRFDDDQAHDVSIPISER